MCKSIRTWLVSAALAGVLSTGAGAAIAWAQEPPDGTRAELRENRAEFRQLELQTQLDRRQLRAHLRRFGPGSLQVQTDRARLRHDELALRNVQRDVRHDRRIFARRHHRFHRG